LREQFLRVVQFWLVDSNVNRHTTLLEFSLPQLEYYVKQRLHFLFESENKIAFAGQGVVESPESSPV
jgi:hypothetical protein